MGDRGEDLRLEARHHGNDLLTGASADGSRALLDTVMEDSGHQQNGRIADLNPEMKEYDIGQSSRS